MTVINADDLMGVTVENPIAERNDISDLENEIDYPSQKEVNVARVDYPSWAVDTRNVESTGPPHQVSTTADRSPAPHDIAPICEASTSQLNSSTYARGGKHCFCAVCDRFIARVSRISGRGQRYAQRNFGSPCIPHIPFG
jgi:hypothetical protein